MRSTSRARPRRPLGRVVSGRRYGRTANTLTMRRFCGPPLARRRLSGPPPLPPPSQGGEKKAACAQQKRSFGGRLFNPVNTNFAPRQATAFLTQTGHAGGGIATPVAPSVRVKSWANQAVHTGKGPLALPQDAAPNVTKSWSILTAPTVTGNPTALGLTISPTPSLRGLPPIAGAFAHPNGGSNSAGSVLANQFGDASRSSIDPRSRKLPEWLEHVNGELQPGRQSSPPPAGTEATPSAQREHDDKKAGVETAMGEDYSPLRPPSPDSNAGLQGTRISASSDLVDGPEATLADSYSDPWQPTPEPKGRRPRLDFLKAIMKIRALWRF
jgi:hypothetical protein